MITNDKDGVFFLTSFDSSQSSENNKSEDHEKSVFIKQKLYSQNAHYIGIYALFTIAICAFWCFWGAYVGYGVGVIPENTSNPFFYTGIYFMGFSSLLILPILKWSKKKDSFVVRVFTVLYYVVIAFSVLLMELEKVDNGFYNTSILSTSSTPIMALQELMLFVFAIIPTKPAPS